jgi:tetratricopeptide (TPR) repeat protein
MTGKILFLTLSLMILALLSCTEKGEDAATSERTATGKPRSSDARTEAAETSSALQTASDTLASICDTLMAVIEHGGIEAAIDRYRYLREHARDTYNFEEQELNRLGYLLLEKRKAVEAVEIFKLNVEFFPESANVYDSLGEGYLAAGDFDRAVDNYRRSLEIYPDNPIAKAIVKKYGKK